MRTIHACLTVAEQKRAVEVNLSASGKKFNVVANQESTRQLLIIVAQLETTPLIH